MPKVLFAPLPVPGHLHAAARAAHQLTNIGDAVRVAGPAQFRPLFDLHGVVHEPAGERPSWDGEVLEALADVCFGKGGAPGDRAAFNQLLRDRMAGQADSMLRELPRVVEEWQPHVVIADAAISGMTDKIHGVPVLRLDNGTGPTMARPGSGTRPEEPASRRPLLTPMPEFVEGVPNVQGFDALGKEGRNPGEVKSWFKAGKPRVLAELPAPAWALEDRLEDEIRKGNVGIIQMLSRFDVHADVVVGPGNEDYYRPFAGSNVRLWGSESQPHGMLRSRDVAILPPDYGAVGEAIGTETPTLYVPQLGVGSEFADQLQERGLGLTTTPASADPEELAGKFAELLEHREEFGNKIWEFRNEMRVLPGLGKIVAGVGDPVSAPGGSPIPRPDGPIVVIGPAGAVDPDDDEDDGAGSTGAEDSDADDEPNGSDSDSSGADGISGDSSDNSDDADGGSSDVDSDDADGSTDNGDGDSSGATISDADGGNGASADSTDNGDTADGDSSGTTDTNADSSDADGGGDPNADSTDAGGSTVADADSADADSADADGSSDADFANTAAAGDSDVAEEPAEVAPSPDEGSEASDSDRPQADEAEASEVEDDGSGEAEAKPEQPVEPGEQPVDGRPEDSDQAPEDQPAESGSAEGLTMLEEDSSPLEDDPGLPLPRLDVEPQDTRQLGLVLTFAETLEEEPEGEPADTVTDDTTEDQPAEVDAEQSEAAPQQSEEAPAESEETPTESDDEPDEAPTESEDEPAEVDAEQSEAAPTESEDEPARDPDLPDLSMLWYEPDTSDSSKAFELRYDPEGAPEEDPADPEGEPTDPEETPEQEPTDPEGAPEEEPDEPEARPEDFEEPEAAPEDFEDDPEETPAEPEARPEDFEEPEEPQGTPDSEPAEPEATPEDFEDDPEETPAEPEARPEEDAAEPEPRPEPQPEPEPEPEPAKTSDDSEEFDDEP